MTHDNQAARLAIDGGTPVRTEPFPPRHLFGQEEKQAVINLFDQAIENGEPLGYNGPEEEAYCKEFAEFLGGGYADAVNSGTNGIYVALRALGIEPFTEIIVPPMTDPGGLMPVPLINCIPVPADAAPGSCNVAAEQIEARITERTSALLLADIAGLPIEMEPIVALARSHGIPIIEDCAQAHGATYKGRPVGTFGDIAVFSTMFGKHHASGGQGGIVFTKDQELYWQVRRCADRGKPFPIPADQASNMIAALNCNMDELHAAIGRVQLRKLPGIIRRRREIGHSVADGCKQLRTIDLLAEPPECQNVYWFLLFKLDLDAIRVDKETFVAALVAEGLPVDPNWIHAPAMEDWWRNHVAFGSGGFPWSSPAYKGDPDHVYELPNAQETYAGHFRMDVHENWSTREITDTLAALKKVENAYAK